MGGDVHPGDHHSMDGADLGILRESPVDELGGPAQNAWTGVLPVENFAHAIARVQVSLQSCNHAKFWGHAAKIR